MADTILLLYMKEERYGKRMLHFLLSKKNPYLHPELVTEKEKVWQRVGTERQNIVVFTDCEEILEKNKNRFILLSPTYRHGVCTIYPFQKAEEIYGELLLYLGVDREESAPIPSFPPLNKEIWFLFSPDGVGRTEIATMISQYLGQQGKCMYLNLSDFPVWYDESLQEHPDFQKEGVEELLFMTNVNDFAKREERIRKPMGTAYLLPPFPHYKDLLDSTKEDWKELFQRLKEESGYDKILVELGGLTEHTMDLLALGDHILFMSQQGLVGKVRRSVWKQYCHMEGKEKLLEQITWIWLPEEWEEWKELMETQSLTELAQNAPLMSRVKELLSAKGEGEDVCILEDFE